MKKEIELEERLLTGGEGNTKETKVFGAKWLT